MTFARYFKFASYALIGSGFVAIACTGSIDLLALVLFGLVFLASWFIDTEKLHTRLPRRVLNALAVAYVPLYMLDLKLLSRSFVVSTVHLMFLMASVKLLTRATDRDYVYLYLISFAELLAASTMTLDLTFALALLVFVLSGVTTLVLFEMRRSNARALRHARIQPVVVPKQLQGTGLELFLSFPARALSLVAVAMTVLILAIAVPLFLVLPRVSAGIYRRQPGRTQMVSGFSEHVTLGELGRIKLSNSVVMRVRLGEGSPAVSDLKWRGVALDHFDGRAWSRSRLGRMGVPAESNGYFRLEKSTYTTEVLWQTYFLEALSTDVVFAGHRALAVSNEIGALIRDSSDNLFTFRHPLSKIRYSVVSEILRPDPALIREEPPRKDVLQSASLQLPALDPRIGVLAAEIAGGRKNPLLKAQAIEKFLREHYAYSLEMPPVQKTGDPIAVFLFDARKGHCEYFASAMTIMLRKLGIPARLVNGFRMGDYNPIGRDWVVRQYDAHSWVEAYFNPYGWLDFDPTPPDPQRPSDRFTRLLSNFADAVSLWWSEEVVNYDRVKQVRLVRSTREVALELQERASTFIRRVRAGSWWWGGPQSPGWPRTLFWVAAGLAALVTGLLLGRRQWAARLPRALGRLLFPSNRAFVSSFYAEALQLMQARGLVRRRDQTPLEFAESLGAHPARKEFTALTDIYNRIRFGAVPAPVDLAAAHQALKSLRTTLRHP